MDFEKKTQILKKLDTKSLIEKLSEYEDKLDEAMREEASFKNLNHDYLSSGSTDCPEVKRIMAELTAQIPDSDNGKKLNAAQRDAWLMRQRTENAELSAALNRQKEVAFLLDDMRINVEMAKKRLEGAKAVLALRTAQLNFLSNSD